MEIEISFIYHSYRNEIDMNKSILKKILMIVGLGLVFYAVIWLCLVGLTYLLFNVILGKPDNWWGSPTIFSLAAVLWAIGMGIFIYNEWTKRHNGKNKGLMSLADFKKVGTNYLRIDDPEATSKGWIIDSKKLVDGLAYKHLGNSNSIVYGITRAGKTTGFVLPTIYSNATAKDKPCFILTDKKDELYQKTCNFLTKQGYRIWKLDISDATNSNCWNPLSAIWKDYQQYKKADMFSEEKYKAHTSLTDRVNNLLDMLFVQKEGAKDNPFWIESAKEFFAMILYANLDQNIKQSKFTLYELFKQFNNFSAQEWVDTIASIDKWGLVHQHKSIVADVSKAETTYAGVKASAIASLKFLTDATIQKISLDTDLPLFEFDKQPTALFLTLPAVSSDKVKLSSIYLQSFLKMCSELPERENNKEARPIYLLADEIGNIEAISGLSDLITTGLSKKIRCMLVFQSKAQLKAKYPKDYQIIQDNCELMTLIKTKDTELANNLSKAFGTYEKKEKTVNKDKDGQVTGSSYHTKTVPVLSETEILEMPRGKILIWLAGKKPIITHTIPIDQTKWYKKNIEEHDHTFKPVRLIPLHPEAPEEETEEKPMSEFEASKKDKVSPSKRRALDKKKTDEARVIVPKGKKRVVKKDNKMTHEKLAKLIAIKKSILERTK